MNENNRIRKLYESEQDTESNLAAAVGVTYKVTYEVIYLTFAVSSILIVGCKIQGILCKGNSVNV